LDFVEKDAPVCAQENSVMQEVPARISEDSVAAPAQAGKKRRKKRKKKLAFQISAS
jgi:hypothetical protein